MASPRELRSELPRPMVVNVPSDLHNSVDCFPLSYGQFWCSKGSQIRVAWPVNHCVLPWPFSEVSIAIRLPDAVFARSLPTAATGASSTHAQGKRMMSRDGRNPSMASCTNLLLRELREKKRSKNALLRCEETLAREGLLGFTLVRRSLRLVSTQLTFDSALGFFHVLLLPWCHYAPSSSSNLHPAIGSHRPPLPQNGHR